MLPGGFHSRRRDYPNSVLEINFSPSRPKNLASAGGGQDGELQRASRNAILLA